MSKDFVLVKGYPGTGVCVRTGFVCECVRACVRECAFVCVVSVHGFCVVCVYVMCEDV